MRNIRFNGQNLSLSLANQELRQRQSFVSTNFNEVL